VPLVLGALALGVATSELSACGSGSTSGAAANAAKEATSAISGTGAQVTSKTPAAGDPTTTQTASASTETVTKNAPQPGTTKSVTKTATQPGARTSLTKSASKSATIHATQATPATSESGGGGLPWWGWILIGIGIVGVVAATVALGRRRVRPRELARRRAPPPDQTYPPPDPHARQAPRRHPDRRPAPRPVTTSGCARRLRGENTPDHRRNVEIAGLALRFAQPPTGTSSTASGGAVGGPSKQPWRQRDRVRRGAVVPSLGHGLGRDLPLLSHGHLRASGRVQRLL
jgi:hypothetical protein